MSSFDFMGLVSAIRNHVRTGTIDDLSLLLHQDTAVTARFLNSLPQGVLPQTTVAGLKLLASAAQNTKECQIARAMLLRAGGHWIEAERLWLKAIGPKPTASELCELGAIQAQLGRLNDAHQSYFSAFQMARLNGGVALDAGCFFYSVGQLGAAEEALRAACKHLPENPNAWLELGNALKGQMRWADAQSCYEKAHLLDKSRPEPLNNLGTVLKQLGRFPEALAAWAAACATDPQHLFARLNRGALFSELGRHLEAHSEFAQAIAIAPENFHAHYGLAESLHRLGRHGEALAALVTAELLEPQSVQTHLTRGNCFYALGEFEAAISAYQSCLKRSPGYAEAFINWGNALQELNRHDEAIETFNQALAIRPDYAGARWNRSNSDLINGLTQKAWEDYECRHKIGIAARLPKACPPLLQDTIRPDHRVLMLWDQRFGDIIHALRFLPDMMSRCGEVVWQMAPAMSALFSSSFEGARMVGLDEWPTGFDVALPITSLPYRMGAYTGESQQTPAMGCKHAYLLPPADRIGRWKPAVCDGQTRVGLAWRGQPVPPGRSISLEELRPVLQVKGATFYSLQMGLNAAEAREIEWRGISDLGSCIQDFADTAAIISQLDLVLTIDTAIAHLAAAMGKPVWVLLKFGGDWRWVTEKDSQSVAMWYESARVFQQKFPRQWNDPVQQVRENLESLVGLHFFAHS